MKHILFIDSADLEKVRVGLGLGTQTIETVSAFQRQKAQALLPLVEQLLKKNHLKLNDITEIRVNLGPGSFTGLRVGIAIANMLGDLLNIPVNRLPPGRGIFPRYEGSKYDTPKS